MEIKDKKPKKPILFYYAIVIVVLVLLNTLLVPSIAERSIKEVRYDQFLSDLKGSKIDEVNLDDDTIYYTIKAAIKPRFTRQEGSMICRKWSGWRKQM